MDGDEDVPGYEVASETAMLQEEKPEVIKAVVRTNVADGNICIQSNRHLLNSLSDPLEESEFFFDVTLFGAPPPGESSSDLVGIRARKVVLSSASARLMKKFTGDGGKDAHQLEYTFENIPHETVRDIVDYIYHDELILNFSSEAYWDRMQDLIIAAKYFFVDDIADACESFCSRKPQLDSVNCMAMWRFAQTYTCNLLMYASSVYIANNLPAVTAQDDFLSLAFDDFTTLFESESVIAADADQQCLAAVAWLNHDAESRAKHAKEVLNMVPARVGMISRDTILALCEDDIVSRECPDFPKQMLIDIVKRAEPASLTNSLFWPEKQALSGFMQRDAWNVIGGYGAPRQFVQFDLLRRRWETERSELSWALKCSPYSAGAFLLRDRIVVVSGEEVEATRIDEYKFATSEWRRNERQERHYRERGAVCSDGDRNAYIFGGEDSNMWRVPDERYSIDNAGAAQVVTVSDTWFNWCTIRCSSAAAAFDHANYAVYHAGGDDWRNAETYTHSILRYDIFRDEWDIAGKMDVARDALASALMGDDLYMAGGISDGGDALDVVEIFNIRTGKTRAAPNLLTVRRGCSAVALDSNNPNVLCVLGGCVRFGIELSSVEVFDQREGKWTTGVIVPDMPNACAYFGFAASV